MIKNHHTQTQQNTYTHTTVITHILLCYPSLCYPCTLSYFTSYIIHHTSHITHHTSYIIHHTSHITHHTSHITHHTSHIIHHTSHIHTSPITHSHITHHTSHITHHVSHITHHTSHITHTHTHIHLLSNNNKWCIWKQGYVRCEMCGGSGILWFFVRSYGKCVDFSVTCTAKR